VNTDRLKLRRWRSDDLAVFQDISADPQVMEHMPACLDAGQAQAQALRIMDDLENRGWGLWAVEIIGSGEFIGYVGLNIPATLMPFGEKVELAWRLAARRWGRGYASEAARAALDFGFNVLNLDEIVAYTTPGNVRSWRVMEKIGMIRDRQGDFDHPILPPGPPLRPHVLYRKRKS
jgi:RimJ/RimL family protein N-acetyltransferase